MNLSRTSEPVDLSLSDLSHIGVSVTPLQIVSVESMADKEQEQESNVEEGDENENGDGDTSQDEAPAVEVSSPARNLRSSDHSPMRKRKSSNPSSLSSGKAKSISDLLAKKDQSDLVNNNNDDDSMFDPDLKIKDEPVDT